MQDHSPWYQPRGAEIIAQGGANFANSIGQGLQKLGDSIGAALEQRRERAQQELSLGKAAVATFKASPELQKTVGMPLEEFLLKSPREQSSIVHGAIAGSGFEQGQQAERARLQQALQEQQANAALAKAMEAAGTKKFPATQIPVMGVPGMPATTMDMPATSVRQPVTSQSLLDALAQNPQAATTRTGAGVLERALQEQGDVKSQLPFQPVPFEVNGMSGIVSPRTGAIHTKDKAGGTSVADRITLMDRKALLDRRNILTKGLGNDLLLTPEMKAQFNQELQTINAQLGGETPAATKTGTTPPANLPTATNPKTGEKLVYKDGKWQKP